MILFVFAMSELANATVGSFIGSGNLDVDIFGENIFEKISCSWGPGVGFYILFLAFLILGIVLFLEKKKNYKLE
jgi:hypothetical protein